MEEEKEVYESLVGEAHDTLELVTSQGLELKGEDALVLCDGHH